SYRRRHGLRAGALKRGTHLYGRKVHLRQSCDRQKGYRDESDKADGGHQERRCNRTAYEPLRNVHRLSFRGRLLHNWAGWPPCAQTLPLAATGNKMNSCASATAMLATEEQLSRRMRKREKHSSYLLNIRILFFNNGRPRPRRTAGTRAENGKK